ncbi:unnamed protein product [Diplocarpon coronariae]
MSKKVAKLPIMKLRFVLKGLGISQKIVLEEQAYLMLGKTCQGLELISSASESRQSDEEGLGERAELGTNDALSDGGQQLNDTESEKWKYQRLPIQLRIWL